jgi:glutamate formiminotransferase/formiminotetrahydrofolate cyclodeaminase
MGFTIAFAGVRGGLWNVLINLKDITDPGYVAEMRPRCARLQAQAEALLARAASAGDARLEAMLKR